MNCEIFCSSYEKNLICNLIWITLNLSTAFGSIVIFTTLFVPMQEHGISLHLFVSSFIFHSVQYSSVTQLCLTLCNPMNHSMARFLSITNSQSLPKLMSIGQWCHLTISSSVVPISSCPQSFPTSGPFQMSQLFTSGGQNIGMSASTSVLPITQEWFP